MSEFITEVARVMQTEVDTLSSFSQNSANVNTPGYKAVRSSNATVNNSSFSQMVNISSDNQQTSYSYDFSQGAVSQTGMSTNLAVMNDGWFVIDMPEGKHLTRNGSFRLDQDSMLVSSNGYPVLSIVDQPIYIPSGGFSVHANGEIYIGDEQLTQIQILQPQDLSTLKAIGNGVFSFEGDASEVLNPDIVQGALEMSNVDTSSEMVRIVEKTRYIETLQRAMSSYDELLNIGVNQIGQ